MAGSQYREERDYVGRGFVSNRGTCRVGVNLKWQGGRKKRTGRED